MQRKDQAKHGALGSFQISLRWMEPLLVNMQGAAGGRPAATGLTEDNRRPSCFFLCSLADQRRATVPLYGLQLCVQEAGQPQRPHQQNAHLHDRRAFQHLGENTV